MRSEGNVYTGQSPGKKDVSSLSTRHHQKEINQLPLSVSTSSSRFSTTMAWRSKHQMIRAQKSLEKAMESSRLGLDPSTNRFHAPLVYHDGYSSVPNWPTKHTFPMMKFERISHALLTTTSKTVASSNLPRPLVRSKEDFFRPPDFADVPIEEWLDLLNHKTDGDNSTARSRNEGDAIDDLTVENTIKNDFGHRFLRRQLTREEARIIGFREQTHRPELVERTVLEVAGTVLTAQLALKYGIAANLAGGTHHAHPKGGAGYTILNDLAITANLMTISSTKTNQNRVERVLVIDCDVHQGDGTAEYSKLWSNDGRFFTLSIHCESNYPFQKKTSTYDIGLPDHCDDQGYLSALEKSVNLAIREVRPDLVLYDAGVDVYKHDTLGRLDLTEENGIRKRDRWVLDRCVSLGIPVAAVVGGGYDKDIDALGRRHAIVHEECAYVWRKHKLWRRQSLDSECHKLQGCEYPPK